MVERFSSPDLTYGQIEKSIEEYVEGCKKSDLGDYFKSVYGTSKMILNAWSRFILA